MKKATLRASWAKSPSDDVTNYSVIVMNENNGELILNKRVSFLETEVIFDVLEKTALTVTVIASDDVYDSEPVSTSFQVGDLTTPLPPSGLFVETLKVTDVEEEIEDFDSV